MSGKSLVWLKSASTTGPITWTIVPVFISKLADCKLRSRDFEELSRYVFLTNLVIMKRQIFDQLFRVVGRVLHRDHPRTMLRCSSVQKHLVKLKADVVWQDCIQDSLRIRLEKS